MTTGNIKITGSDESVALNFSLDMDLTVANAQRVMVYVIELKAKELAKADTKGIDLPTERSTPPQGNLEAQTDRFQNATDTKEGE